MIQDCFVKNNQGETKMQKSDSKSSTRVQENQDSQQKPGNQGIWVVHKFNGKWGSV